MASSTTKNKGAKKKTSDADKAPRPRNSGMFKKGNTIGSDTRFKPGNTDSLKYSDDMPERMLEYAKSDEGIYPTLTGFAMYLGVSPRVVYDWKDAYPRFADAVLQMDDIRAQKLAEGGITRAYDAGMVRFLLSAVHGYSEKTKTEAEVKQEITVTINGIE